MKKYSDFLNEQSYKPDLRDIGTRVRCIKNYPNDMIYKPYFKKGDVYNIIGMWGDPQEAVEKYGIEGYLPIECISVVELRKDETGKEKFKVNSEKYPVYQNYMPDFFQYFELLNGGGSHFRKKIRNKEIDPFGEENWWETSENLLTEQVYEPDMRKVDSYVRCIKNFTKSRLLIFEKGKKYRVLRKRADSQKVKELAQGLNYLPIECMTSIDIELDRMYMDYMTFRVDKNPDHYRHTPYFLEYFEPTEKVRKKIRNKEIDPFGEENWWETNESILNLNNSLTEMEVQETLKKYSNQLNKNSFFETNDSHYVWCKGWFNKKIFISITKQFTIDGERFFLYFHQDTILMNNLFRITFINFEDCEKFLKNCNLEIGDMQQYQKRKRMTHIQEDPFDEEIWYEK